MADVEVRFGPQPSSAGVIDRESESLSLPEDDDTEDAQELRAMIKSHDYWQRKPSAAQSNPFEDS